MPLKSDKIWWRNGFLSPQQLFILLCPQTWTKSMYWSIMMVMTGDSTKPIFHKFTSAYLKATFYLEHAEFVKVTPFIPMWLLSVHFADTCMLYLMMYGWCIWHRKSDSLFDLSKEHCHSRLSLYLRTYPGRPTVLKWRKLTKETF